jgi:DNA-binding MarR family transcriptional regulator
MERDELIETIFTLRTSNMHMWKSLFGKSLQKENITHQQMGLLFTIHERQPVMGKEIAQELFLTASSITQVVDSLVHAGYVTRQQDTKDRRIVYLRLTEQGEQKIAHLNSLRKKFLYMSVETLTDEELQGELHNQKKMLEQLQEYVATKK